MKVSKVTYDIMKNIIMYNMICFSDMLYIKNYTRIHIQVKMRIKGKIICMEFFKSLQRYILYGCCDQISTSRSFHFTPMHNHLKSYSLIETYGGEKKVNCHLLPWNYFDEPLAMLKITLNF